MDPDSRLDTPPIIPSVAQGDFLNTETAAISIKTPQMPRQAAFQLE